MPNSYNSLLALGTNDLRNLAFERDRSVPGQGVARNSMLLAAVASGPHHKDVRLDTNEYERLVTWMDTYAQRTGHFSDAQERELEQLRTELAPEFLIER